jgi:hypothetical protein
LGTFTLESFGSTEAIAQRADYAASRIRSNLKGSTKQSWWLQAPAKAFLLSPATMLALVLIVNKISDRS